ncbi:hypothetical protein [Mesorhizobium sp. M1E.F.Ca.ET.063.01.1.1]|uniref:hypothetical protein n=1 Tax=Mesorhizobium sp. M1E.F.Ca.ET.063.01.1.1 TaxID=2496750 RepID=UPI001672A7B9|nr:hypothetical protein [Mesorhizobium sp. M1E.F.Ca.ET.063.01.1.1]
MTAAGLLDERRESKIDDLLMKWNVPGLVGLDRPGLRGDLDYPSAIRMASLRPVNAAMSAGTRFRNQ